MSRKFNGTQCEKIIKSYFDNLCYGIKYMEFQRNTWYDLLVRIDRQKVYFEIKSFKLINRKNTGRAVINIENHNKLNIQKRAFYIFVAYKEIDDVIVAFDPKICNARTINKMIDFEKKDFKLYTSSIMHFPSLMYYLSDPELFKRG